MDFNFKKLEDKNVLSSFDISQHFHYLLLTLCGNKFLKENMTWNFTDV